MITVTINAVNRTSDIAQRSLRYNKTLSKSPGTLTFAIDGKKTMPTVGQSVLVQVDAVNFFKGVITARAEEIMGGNHARYKFTCQDGFFTMDRKLVVKAYNNTTLNAVATDIVNNFTTGFTLDIPASTPTIKTVRFNYEQPTQCLTKLVQAVGWDWYVDANDVIHVLPPEDMAAPYVIDESLSNHDHKSLTFDRNIIDLRNIVFVRGGEYDDPIAEADAVDKYEANGIDNTFPLAYRYSQTEVTVNGVAKTVGVDFLDDPLLFDCLYNYQEKLVRFPSGTLASGAIVRVFGNSKVPLIVQAEDSDSVLLYGEREAVEINKSIESIAEAELLATSLLDKWREGSKEGQFETTKTGWVVGQTVSIIIPTLSINESYKVNRVSASMHDHDNFKYTIEFIKSGQTELTDLLIGLIGKERNNVVIADNEVLQRVRRVADAFGITDQVVSVTKTSKPYGFFPVTTKTVGKFDFSTFG